MSTEGRFWKKVAKGGGADACWEWAAAKNRKGYGIFKADGKSVLAHRFSYELENGPIPEGLCACHKCDRPGCVNPTHIFLGTDADNAADREAKGRGNQPSGDRHGSRTKPGAFRSNCPSGERNGMAKLTAAQVDEIRAAYEAGVATQAELGRRFGVLQQAVSRIVRGAGWKGRDSFPLG